MISQFFIKPKLLFTKNDSFLEKIELFFWCLLWLFGIIIIWGIFFKVMDTLSFKLYNHPIMESVQKERTTNLFSREGYSNITIIILVVPILEEIAYRLLLNLKKHTVIISLVAYCAIHVGDHIFSLSVYSFGTWTKIVSMLLIIVIGNLVIKQSFLDIQKDKFFIIVFYLLAMLFAFNHTAIYLKNLQGWLLISLPLFVLPQFFLAIFSGFLRLKNGIIWAILLHTIFNTPIVLNYIYQ